MERTAVEVKPEDGSGLVTDPADGTAELRIVLRNDGRPPDLGLPPNTRTLSIRATSAETAAATDGEET